MNGFSKFSCTNIPREVSRSVEDKFGVELSRTRVDFISSYNKKPGYYYKYRLPKSEKNQKGIKKMREYIAKNITEYRPGSLAKKGKTAVEKTAPQPVKDLFSELL